MTDTTTTADSSLTFGAWVWLPGDFSNPESTVQKAQALGLDYLHLMVNTAEPPTASDAPFALRDEAELTALARLAHNPPSGKPLAIALTSWIIPYQDYIEQAAKALVPLCAEIGATSLLWDAEGPWFDGNGMAHQAASALIKTQFAGLACPMGVTSFVDVPATVAPLAAVCDYGLPQAYSPDALAPGTSQRQAWAMWKPFTEDRSTPFELVMGLASYDQGTDASAITAAMTTAFETTTSLGARNVCYWAFNYFDGDVAAVLQGFTGVAGSAPVEPSTTTYVIKAGDTLNTIAATHHVTLQQLLAANPQITNPDVIHAGEVINIP